MKELIKEYSIKRVLPKIKKGDVLIVLANKQYDLKVEKVINNKIIVIFKDEFYSIDENSLENNTLYFNKIDSAQKKIGGGSIKNVITIRIVRGYDTIDIISTSKKLINSKSIEFIKDTFIDLRDNVLPKINVNEELMFGLGYMKQKESEKDNDNDSDLIDETTLTDITIIIQEELEKNKMKGKVTKVTGYESRRYFSLLNKTILFDKTKLNFSEDLIGEESGIFLKCKILENNDIVIINNILSIDNEKIDDTKTDNEKENDSLSDMEIYKIVQNDPIMSKLLHRKPNFWDFILGKTHDQTVDDAMDSLRSIRNKLNKNSPSPNKIIGKVYTIKFLSKDIEGQGKFDLIKGEDYTIKIFSTNPKKIIVGLYEFNKINSDHNIYTIDFFDKLKKGVNRGKLYFGGKAENKNRKLLGSVEINIM